MEVPQVVHTTFILEGYCRNSTKDICIHIMTPLVKHIHIQWEVLQFKVKFTSLCVSDWNLVTEIELSISCPRNTVFNLYAVIKQTIKNIKCPACSRMWRREDSRPNRDQTRDQWGWCHFKLNKSGKRQFLCITVEHPVSQEFYSGSMLNFFDKPTRFVEELCDFWACTEGHCLYCLKGKKAKVY